MDFKDNIRQLGERVTKLKDQIATEEATKNAFIMPFIQILGYDVFNPLEVIPELDCDLIKKRGEKIDYAIVKDGEPIMLIECKHWMQDLNLHSTQLQKYFVASKAKFGVLTNGIVYQFFTDLEKPNIMDDTPFLELNLENLKDQQIEAVKKFHKSYFDVENILSSASELKYMAELKSIIKNEFSSPSVDMVKMLARKVYDGTITQKVLEQFTDLVRRSFASHINDVMSERLNIAIQSTSSSQEKTETANKEIMQDEDESPEKGKIITTEEELEGFYIVKAILHDIIPPENIVYRDSVTRFSIFYSKNKSVTICSLWFNCKQKKLGFQKGKGEIDFVQLNSVDDIWEHSERIINSAKTILQ